MKYEGLVKCIDCGHEEDRAIETDDVTNTWICCNGCGMLKARFKNVFEYDSDSWLCVCGCSVFSIYKEGVLCYNCGQWQEF